MTKHTALQLNTELEDILSEYLFRAYHSKSHLEDRHIGKDLRYLKGRIHHVRGIDDVMSTFTCSYAEALHLIHEALVTNVSGIKKWYDNNRYKERLTVVYDFDHPVGFGIVKGANWNETFEMSRINVVLEASNEPGRLFTIVTAYPIFNMDESDVVWDAIEEWQSR